MAGAGVDHEGLLRACAQRDQQAFKTLYDAEAGRMLALAARMLRRRGEAEELVQDAFIQIWNNADRFDSTLGTGRAWIYSILRYRVLNRLRAKGEMPLDDALMEAQIDQSPEPDEAADGRRQAHRLDLCLEHLDDPRRGPILLAFYQGLSHGQIASRLETPLGTIKSRIRAGLRALQECLQT